MIKVEVTDVFDKWLKGLRDLRGKERIFERIRRLGEGLFGDVKSVGDGVSEARVNYGPGYRLYFDRRGEELVILLCGGDKSSQRRDIAKAMAIAKQRE